MELTPLDNKEGDESDIKRKHWFTVQDDALEAFREIVGLSESTGGKKKPLLFLLCIYDASSARGITDWVRTHTHALHKHESVWMKSRIGTQMWV